MDGVFTSWDLFYTLVVFAVLYFTLGDTVEDLLRDAYKRYRARRFGEEDHESFNAGFRVKVDGRGLGRSSSDGAKVWKRPGSQLNVTPVQNPHQGSQALRERE